MKATQQTAKPNGKGRYYNRYEEVEYEGDFVNGELHGKGKLTYPNGKIEEGNWENGKYKE